MSDTVVPVRPNIPEKIWSLTCDLKVIFWRIGPTGEGGDPGFTPVWVSQETATGETKAVKFFGHGADVDILHAAAKAYVNGINRMLCARENAAEGPSADR